MGRVGEGMGGEERGGEGMGGRDEGGTYSRIPLRTVRENTKGREGAGEKGRGIYIQRLRGVEWRRFPQFYRFPH